MGATYGGRIRGNNQIHLKVQTKLGLGEPVVELKVTLNRNVDV